MPHQTSTITPSTPACFSVCKPTSRAFSRLMTGTCTSCIPIQCHVCLPARRQSHALPARQGQACYSQQGCSCSSCSQTCRSTLQAHSRLNSTLLHLRRQARALACLWSGSRGCTPPSLPAPAARRCPRGASRILGGWRRAWTRAAGCKQLSSLSWRGFQGCPQS